MTIERMLNPEFYQGLLLQARDWALVNIFVAENFFALALQVLALVLARAAGEVAGRMIRKVIQDRLPDLSGGRLFYISSLVSKTVRLIPFLLSIFLLWISIKVFDNLTLKFFLLTLVLNLSMAWAVIQVATSVIGDSFWRRVLAVFAWLCAALNIIGLLDETIQLLEGIGFSIGTVHLNLLSVIKASVLLIVLYKAIQWVSSHLEKSLEAFSQITPSSRLMITKTINVTLFFLATLMALNSMGIDLTALAVFSGAIGVGVGFGLQKVVANFISGLILLSDKSVKPGDVIEIDAVYGWVKQMGGRCVSVITQDQKEYLIPNEDLITRQVVNWSYSSKQIRVKADVGVSYKADIHRAIAVITEAAGKVERVLGYPAPKCILTGFGDSSVDLQIRFWIKDPQNGVANVRSEVLLEVWDTLKAHDIEIPFPQRDVHLKLPQGVSATASVGAGGKGGEAPEGEEGGNGEGN